MKPIRTIVVLVCFAAVTAGCASGPLRAGKNCEALRSSNVALVESLYDDSVKNGVIAQSTIFPYHFAYHGPRLNDLGGRDLGILAEHYKNEIMPTLTGGKITDKISVYFDYDKAEIREDAAPVLDEAAAILRENPQTTILVTGRADVRGSHGYNERLGARRANAVEQYLVSKGIGSSRIRILSRGELDAIAPVTDSEGMQKDRNADFMVTEGKDPYPVVLNVRQGDASDELYEARVNTVVRFLEDAGVDTDLITIADGLPRGDGLDSESVVFILSEQKEAS